MGTDDKLNEMIRALPGWPYLAAAGAAAVLVLVLLAVVLRKLRKGKLASRVTALATILGMAWSAQGMWDVTVNKWNQHVLVASVLFVVFEAMLFARMLKAHEYRTDFARRGKHVQAVWLIACIMAAVVASGEGWTQAPARLAIPLLVAYGWYVDLTAADDPKAKPRTSWRWTPRRALLAVGALEAGEKDAEQIDRDRLRARMTRLAFKIEHGDAKLSDILNRKTRLARLKTLANDDDITEVRARLARSRMDLTAEPPATEQEKAEPAARAPRKPRPVAEPERRPQGVHERVGRTLRGAELKADAVTLMLRSITAERPKGMTSSELATLYTPPLGVRTAESFAAEARKAQPINGKVPELTA
jgi:prepilin signal peptidase PulO-like enzyme (type II secretory pathway)